MNTPYDLEKARRARKAEQAAVEFEAAIAAVDRAKFEAVKNRYYRYLKISEIKAYSKLFMLAMMDKR